MNLGYLHNHRGTSTVGGISPAHSREETHLTTDADTKPVLEIFTDGACQGNPGPGGWGAITRNDTTERERSGYDPATTSNRMELTAAVEALKALSNPRRVRLYSDSRYLVDGMTRWVQGWKANDWWKPDGTPVKNKDLWEALEEAAAPHEVEWVWIKGHAGHPENERADALANAAIVARKGRRGPMKPRVMAA